MEKEEEEEEEVQEQGISFNRTFKKEFATWHSKRADMDGDAGAGGDTRASTPGSRVCTR